MSLSLPLHSAKREQGRHVRCTVLNIQRGCEVSRLGETPLPSLCHDLPFSGQKGEDVINAAEELKVRINERWPAPTICLHGYWVILFQWLICYFSKRLSLSLFFSHPEATSRCEPLPVGRQTPSPTSAAFSESVAHAVIFHRGALWHWDDSLFPALWLTVLHYSWDTVCNNAGCERKS